MKDTIVTILIFIGIVLVLIVGFYMSIEVVHVPN